MISKKKIEELALERMQELNSGLFLVDIRISASSQIRVEIDKKGGNVSIEECVSVSRNIEHNLDRESQDFELSVSSPGLDKPLRVFEQYQKNVGRQVQIKTQDGRELEGELKSALPEGITIETKSKERIEGKKKKEWVIEQHELPFDQIKETKIVISFK